MGSEKSDDARGEPGRKLTDRELAHPSCVVRNLPITEIAVPP